MASLFEQLMAAQGISPLGPGSSVDGLFQNNAFDSVLTVKSPAGGGAGQAPVGGGQQQPQAPGQAGPSPNTLGLINLASQLAQAILGGRENTVMGGVAGATGDITKNMLRFQLLQQLTNQGREGGTGDQAVPFLPAL